MSIISNLITKVKSFMETDELDKTYYDFMNQPYEAVDCPSCKGTYLIQKGTHWDKCPPCEFREEYDATVV